MAIGQRGRAREAVDSLLAEAGAARRIALTVPSAYGALMAAARSQMVACAPEPLWRATRVLRLSHEGTTRGVD